jgi:hypothetical protein
MADWFPPDFGHTGTGYLLSLRATVAAEIVKHCALVTGLPNGEDTAGRQKLGLMSAESVASRANDIANYLVDEWEDRAWVRPVTMTLDEEQQELGRLAQVRHQVEWKETPDDLAARAARVKARMEAAREREKEKSTPSEPPQS